MRTISAATLTLLLLPAGVLAAERPAVAASTVPLPPPPAGATPVPRPATVAPDQKGAATPARVDVAVRRLADQLAAGYARRPSSRYERVAVLDLSENGAGAKDRSLGKVVSTELATTLRRDHGWLLVERARLGAILSEQRLGVMGVTAPSDRQVQEIGKFADAQAVVLGSVSEVGDRYLVSARLVTVDRAENLAAASESIQAASLVALASDAVVLRSRGDAAYRSTILPGWGQLYNRQPAKAALFGGGVALLVGGAVGYHLAGAKAEDDYRSKSTATALGGDPAQAAAELRKRAEDRYATRNALLIGAAALWALNVGDAWLSGTDGERLVVAGTPTQGGLALAVAGRF